MAKKYEKHKNNGGDNQRVADNADITYIIHIHRNNAKRVRQGKWGKIYRIFI